MDILSASTLMRRAQKRMRHAIRAEIEATSPAAKARHARRLRRAQRQHADARWTFENLACSEPDALA